MLSYMLCQWLGKLNQSNLGYCIFLQCLGSLEFHQVILQRVGCNKDSFSDAQQKKKEFDLQADWPDAIYHQGIR